MKSNNIYPRFGGGFSNILDFGVSRSTFEENSFFIVDHNFTEKFIPFVAV